MGWERPSAGSNSQAQMGPSVVASRLTIFTRAASDTARKSAAVASASSSDSAGASSGPQQEISSISFIDNRQYIIDSERPDDVAKPHDARRLIAHRRARRVDRGRRPHARDGHRARHRSRDAGVVHRDLGHDDGGDDAAVGRADGARGVEHPPWGRRSEEHTSELRSRENLVCRLLLEKKKKTTKPAVLYTQKKIINHIKDQVDSR